MALSALTTFFLLASFLHVGIAIFGGFHCDFDKDTCGFTQRTDDNIDWRRHTGETPFKGTGPLGDSSIGGQGYYMYIQANGSKVNDIAIIEKTNISVCGEKQSLKFDYNMYGSDMGTLTVTRGNVTIFSRRGDQGKGWDDVRVEFPSKGIYKIAFQGTISTGPKGDIAIDRISISSCAFVWFTNSSLTVSEGHSGAVQICVRREADPGRKVTDQKNVRVSIANGTAVRSEDFSVSHSVLVRFMPSQFIKCIRITIRDDDMLENTETFYAILENVPSSLFVDESRKNMTVHIIDNDKVSFGFSRTSLTVSEGGTYASVCMTRKGQVAKDLENGLRFSVKLSTVQETASIFEDFLPLNFHIVDFGVNETYKCVNVTIKDDDVVENMETFFITMTNNSNVVAVNGTRNNLTINIRDDDTVTIGFSKASLSVLESDPYVPICMTIEGETSSNIQSGLLSVRLSTIQGTAAKDQDFITWFNSTLVTFEPGETSKCVNVNLTDDDIEEGTEQFVITMANGSHVVKIKDGRHSLTVNIRDIEKGIIQFEEEYKKEVKESLEDGAVELACVIDRAFPFPLQISFEVDFTSTATEGSDFTIENKTLTFQPGQTKVPVKIKINRDGEAETNEIVVLRMVSSDAKVEIGRNNTAKIKINDKLDNDIQAERLQKLENGKHQELVILLIVAIIILAFVMLFIMIACIWFIRHGK